MNCNYNLRELAVRIKEGVRAAGGTPMEFNTVAISDGITMGTEGMKASLVSRELIADSMELMARGYFFDAMVALVGCDKTIPGRRHGAAARQRAGLLLYGGSIMPGRLGDRDLTIQDVFEAVGAHAAGKITDDELREIEDFACPGAGACGGQFTANTMAMALEFCGLSAMGTAGVPADDPHKGDVGYQCGELIMDVLRRGLKPRDIFTQQAIENAIAGIVVDGRLDQRRAAPDGDGARGRRPARDRRLRSHQLAHAAARRHATGRPLRGRRPGTRRWHAAGRPAPGRGRLRCIRTRSR